MKRFTISNEIEFKSKLNPIELNEILIFSIFGFFLGVLIGLIWVVIFYSKIHFLVIFLFGMLGSVIHAIIGCIIKKDVLFNYKCNYIGLDDLELSIMMSYILEENNVYNNIKKYIGLSFDYSSDDVNLIKIYQFLKKCYSDNKLLINMKDPSLRNFVFVGIDESYIIKYKLTI